MTGSAIDAQIGLKGTIRCQNKQKYLPHEQNSLT